MPEEEKSRIAEDKPRIEKPHFPKSRRSGRPPSPPRNETMIDENLYFLPFFGLFYKKIGDAHRSIA